MGCVGGRGGVQGGRGERTDDLVGVGGQGGVQGVGGGTGDLVDVGSRVGVQGGRGGVTGDLVGVTRSYGKSEQQQTYWSLQGCSVLNLM